jgi:TetR/AcrR family transcriptional repressor of nem operon
MVKTKGERTREEIVARAATVFNFRGYARASIADILEATGLEKGGLYNHFSSKDELALAAFDYSARVMEERHRLARLGRVGARETLRAFLDVFRETAERSTIKGGCPLLNTAVEATNNHPRLRERARSAFERLHGRLEDIVATGVAAGELHGSVDPSAVATLFICSLEGAVMLSRLHRDDVHMQRVVDHLGNYVDSLMPTA